MKGITEILIPQTATFEVDTLNRIRLIAKKSGWSTARAIRVLCVAGIVQIDRDEAERAGILAGHSQIDPDAFSKPRKPAPQYDEIDPAVYAPGEPVDEFVEVGK